MKTNRRVAGKTLTAVALGLATLGYAPFAQVFGCWTSVSRNCVLPVFEQTNSLLF